MARQDVGTARVIRGNALDLALPDGSVDLIVTSPPYFGLRSYQDGGEHYDGQIGDETTPADFVDALIAATAEMARVLKSSGSIWVNLGDKYSSTSAGSNNNGSGSSTLAGTPSIRDREAQSVRKIDSKVPTKSLIGIPWRYALRCIDDLGLILRAEVIWSKPNGLPESVTDRVRRSHEQWFHFTKSPRYFSSVDEIREEHLHPTVTHTGPRVARGEVDGNAQHLRMGLSPLGKLPSSVWTIASQPLRVPESLGIDHFAAFPMEWPRRIIRGWAPEGGTVLDPFGGTGTTALVAKAWGRHGISNDMSADYCRLAEWRTNDPDQLAMAMQVDKPTKQVAGQADLFDMLTA